MSFKKVLWIAGLLIGIQLAVDLSHANEDAAPEPAKAPTTAETSPWVSVETKIQELSAKAKNKEALIQKMIEEKRSMKDGSSELRNKITELVREHKDLEKMTKDLQQQVNLLKYRFPERYSRTDRKYDRLQVKTLEEMEQALGVDGKLSRNMHRFRTQYQVPPPVDQRSPASAPAEGAPGLKQKEQSIEEADSIILRK